MSESAHPALAGLDDVPWSEVRHAFGPATDVPELLRQLTGTREQQEHALGELYGNVWHQGTVYEATAHVVPFLARLALAEPVPLRDELLGLLAEIANGSSYLDAHEDALPGGLSEEQRAQLPVELAHVAAARAAVLDAAPQLVERLMAEQTPAGLALVARFAAAYPDVERPFADALEWISDNGEDLRVRAALAVALVRRGDEDGYADAILADLVDDLQVRPEP